MSGARLGALVTDEVILEPLRRVAEGSADLERLQACAFLFANAWQHLAMLRSIPGGCTEAHAALQSVMLAAMQQGAVLRALVPAQQQRAVRRARRQGFLQVRLDPQPDTSIY